MVVPVVVSNGYEYGGWGGEEPILQYNLSIMITLMFLFTMYPSPGTH